MKYIKIFEDFNTDLTSEIKNILIDLVDIGFDVDVDVFTNRDQESRITITIVHDYENELNTIHYVGEISENIDRLDSYIKYKYSITNIEYGWWNEFEHEYQEVNTLIGCYASRFRIEYKIK